MRSPCNTAVSSSPHSSQLEKAHMSNEDPVQPKVTNEYIPISKKINKKIRKRRKEGKEKGITRFKTKKP